MKSLSGVLFAKSLSDTVFSVLCNKVQALDDQWGHPKIIPLCLSDEILKALDSNHFLTYSSLNQARQI